MGFLVILILTALVTVYQLTKDPFADAVGDWKSIDRDGSNQTLSIKRSFMGEYTIKYYDDNAVPCGDQPASAEFTAHTKTHEIYSAYDFVCLWQVDKKGRTENAFIYDGDIDQIKDMFGTTWTRQN